MSRLTRPGQRQAGDASAQIARGKTGLAKTLVDGFKNGGKAFRQSEANIGRPRTRLAQLGTRRRGQASATSGSAAVDPEEQRIRVHERPSRNLFQTITPENDSGSNTLLFRVKI